MKQKLLLIISIISLFILEIELENYGVGYGLFNPNLPYKLNTDFDKYQGFDIEEEGFITVLGKNSILFDEKGDTLRVKEVLNYGKN
jgi:hypothetical protein